MAESTCTARRRARADKERWTPVSKGAIYCSPACGYRCTHAAYKKAHAAIDRCIKQLSGGKWIGEVWEHMGWHWKVTRGRIEVRAAHEGGYTCYAHFAGETIYSTRVRRPQRGVNQILLRSQTILACAVRTLSQMAGK